MWKFESSSCTRRDGAHSAVRVIVRQVRPAEAYPTATQRTIHPLNHPRTHLLERNRGDLGGVTQRVGHVDQALAQALHHRRVVLTALLHLVVLIRLDAHLLGLERRQRHGCELLLDAALVLGVCAGSRQRSKQ